METNRIAELFKNKTIFITGGSGFLGKTLIEKLLRTCPEIKTIYLLIRNKKNKTPNERLKDLFNNVLFNVLKKQQPNVLEKCKAICGDVTEVDLAISNFDRRLLQNEVEFIYHSAATTRFDDSLKIATQINTRGTKYVLDLAKQCKKLKLFIHVSSAYVFPKVKVLYDRIYQPPANPHEVLNSINWINDDGNEEITKKLLGDCPNTYTFTKALAEGLVAEQMGTLPCIIVRPSIVVPVFSDPLPGWCNNLQGPMGLFVGAGKGIIRSMYVNSESHADFMPADVAINLIILCTWHYVNIDKSQSVFNITSSSEYTYTWGEIIELGKDVATNVMPFNGIVWYPGGSMKKYKWLHTIAFYLFQILPALFIDLLLICLGYKPILYQIQRRIQKGGDMFEYYTNKVWNFSNEKVCQVREKLNKTEKQVYRVDGEGLVLKTYFTDCIHFVRVHILKETDDMLPAARRNLKIMWAVDFATKILIVLWVVYYIYKSFWN